MLDYKKFDDNTLMRLIEQGRSEALSELYDRYSRLAFSVAFNAIGDYATAEEITQDVFTRVWEKSGTYDMNLSKVSTWLVSITRNRAIDELRRGRIRPEQYSVSWDEVQPEKTSSNDDPEETTKLAWERNIVRQAISDLPMEQQRVLALAYFKGYTHSEIAEATGEPLGTVKTRIRLAMQKLRQVLSELDLGNA